jgi:hypothetical protein
MKEKINLADYSKFVRKLHPEWRSETVAMYAERLCDTCEIIGATLKDFENEKTD